MNIEMHGKEVNKIYLADSDGTTVTRGSSMKLYLSVTYHGDRDEFWVVVEENGKEYARHNCKNIETIVWADEV